MTWRQLSPKALWTQLLWAVAVLFPWAALVTERVLEYRGGPLRTVLIALGTFIVVGSASFAAGRLSRSKLRYLPWLLLASVAGRLWHRHALRQQYERAPIRVEGPAESLWHPVTTTDLGVRYYTLTSDRFAAERVRLVMLADLHVTRALPRAYYQRIFELVRAQHADLILLAGDYASEPENIELMADLIPRHWPARVGVFAVLGNHDLETDSARIRAVLRSTGVTLVGGRCEHLPTSIGKVAVCGTETPWGPELSTTLDPSELNLVLSHTPDNIYRLAEQGATVVFSGHTHGGQIRLPRFGSVVVPSRFGGLFDQGHFRVDGAELFVSAGVGADMPPLRIYCPPEISVVDVTRP